MPFRFVSIAAAAALTASGLAAAAQPPEPEAAAVWNHLEQANYRANWGFWPGKQAFYRGTEPHGMLLTTYVNDRAADALRGGSGALPPGAMIVKENYSPAKELKAVTVMYKAASGYDPQHGDWFWMKRLPDGTVEAAGRVESCQSCHQAGRRDYLMTPLPE